MDEISAIWAYNGGVKVAPKLPLRATHSHQESELNI